MQKLIKGWEIRWDSTFPLYVRFILYLVGTVGLTVGGSQHVRDPKFSSIEDNDQNRKTKN